MGKKAKGCPYFVSRDLLNNEEVILIMCPYNYIIDPIIRKSMGLDAHLNDAVVVIDEAHNVEDVCREASSFEIALADLCSVTQQLEQIETYGGPASAAQLVQKLVAFLRSLASWLGTFRHLPRRGPSDSDSGIVKSFAGVQAAVALEHSCNFNSETVKSLRTCFEEMSKQDKDGESTWGSSVGLAPEASGYVRNTLDRLITVLENVINEKHTPKYRVNVMRIAPSSASKSSSSSAAALRDDASFAVGKDGDVKLCFWCMSPAVAFRSLAKKTRSILLTSGTLSPLNSVEDELETPFRFKIEASRHVIDVKTQLWCRAISYGAMPSSKQSVLNATYRNASTQEYQDSLGASIAKAAASIPEGVLVFFPSYSLLYKCVERWRSGTVWQMLVNAKRLVLVEPRKSFQAGQKRKRNGRSNDSSSMQNVLAKYRKACSQSIKGAILFCVFRGKMSEGIDFRDEQARAAIIVGIPYPNVMDPKVKMKKDYQDSKKSARAGKGGRVLSGGEWYTQQAYRALNQALGRCIRHKNDYGAILLMDYRFSRRESVGRLSKWVRETVVPSKTVCEDTIASLSRFFSSAHKV